MVKLSCTSCVTRSPLARLPVLEVEVPQQELPLPEGVGDEKLRQDNLSMREIEDSWREKLHENAAQHAH